MFYRKPTTELSIRLLIDENAAKDIKRIRDLMPPSPYRDDLPHLTVLDKIKAPRDLGDDDLYQILKHSLNNLFSEPILCHVKGVSNENGGYYKITSAVSIELCPQLRSGRSDLVKALRSRRFKVKRCTRAYDPHISIRLGVAMTDSTKQLAEELFPKGRVVKLKCWEIYRLIPGRSQRTFYLLASAQDQLSTD